MSKQATACAGYFPYSFQVNTETGHIIVHEYEVRSDKASKEANIKLKNFAFVSFSNYKPHLKRWNSVRLSSMILSRDMTFSEANDVFSGYVRK